MAYKMDIQRLNKAELTYELKLRGFMEVGTVDQMRECLRNLMRLDNTENSLTYPDYALIFEDEIKTIESKVKDISELIDELETGKKSGPALKIETKLAHILKRGDRLKPDGDVQVRQKSTVLTRIMEVVSKYEKKASEVETNVSRHQLPHASTPVNTNRDDSVASEHATTFVKPIPVSKWNLKFNGECRDLSVNAFLERVDELRIARRVSKPDLFNSALDLFTGKALVWFRAARKRCNNWDELTVLLKEEFQPPEYDDRLLDEIKRRTQGKTESVGIFLATMTNMFGRMTEPVSEATQLKIVLNNLSPFYQANLSLTEIGSLTELSQYCKKLETRKYHIDNYVLPTRSKHDLEPDLAYVSTDASDFASPSTSLVTAINAMTCWNCNRSGHRSAQCTERKNKHCYRCGYAGFTVKNCPKCSISGNEPRGN